jgi:hypothetical protein
MLRAILGSFVLVRGKIPMAQWDVKWKQAHEKQTMLKCEIEKYQQQLDENQSVLKELQTRLAQPLND